MNEIIGSGYSGRAGEYAVCSELLFRGYNAGLLGVDDGIDIVASKRRKTFYFQVKTANAIEDEAGRAKYYFKINKVSFYKHNKRKMYYVFVLRRNDYIGESQREPDLERFYVVMPSARLLPHINGSTSQDVTIRIYWHYEDRELYIQRRGESIIDFLNAWRTVR